MIDMKRAAVVGLAVAGLGLSSLVTAAPASAGGTAPDCVKRNVFTVVGRYWEVSVQNTCGKPMRVRVVGSFGPFDCHTLQNGASYRHHSEWGKYKRVEVC
ncbi:hypothetical protein GKJPGBOP_02440 [Streptomyces paromomycinus]|uniref:Uncharacterized protein n=2 Tax=Streptomyces paromomycinus TaxID=92743 RepID=A0A401W0F5_STREY|nr:hypothetical protein GKJPGBOP_02440 [Streptomyces paromomycinus]